MPGTGLRVVKRYTLHDPVYGSGVVVPPGWGNAWRTYRDSDTAATRREFVFYGDSTTYGSEGNYSYVTRVRERAIRYGCADGGKGIFGGGEGFGNITYDNIAGEVNGQVSNVGWDAVSDQYDTLIGQYYYSTTPGSVITLRFRTTAARLWYVDRPSDGSITYSVDGGAAVSLDVTNRTSGGPLDKFLYLSGYSANTTKVVTITNVGSRGGDTSKVGARVALAPVNDVGVVFQKQATSGGTIAAFFHGGVTPVTGGSNSSRYQAPLGLVPLATGGPSSADGYATGNTVDTSYPAAARVKPILAMMNLAFNDLTNVTSPDYTLFTEGIRKFAAACRAAGVEGIVTAGNSPVNAKWPTYGVDMYNAMKAQAASENLAWVDMWQPFGGALAYTGGTANPHLAKSQYMQQGDFLWDSLLGV